MRKHWYLLFSEDDYRVDKGVQHCWIREGSDSSWRGGSYYPNFGKWQKMVEEKQPPFDNPEVTGDGDVMKMVPNSSLLLRLNT